MMVPDTDPKEENSSFPPGYFLGRCPEDPLFSLLDGRKPTPRMNLLMAYMIAQRQRPYEVNAVSDPLIEKWQTGLREMIRESGEEANEQITSLQERSHEAHNGCADAFEAPQDFGVSLEE